MGSDIPHFVLVENDNSINNHNLSAFLLCEQDFEQKAVVSRETVYIDNKSVYLVIRLIGYLFISHFKSRYLALLLIHRSALGLLSAYI